LALEEVVEGLGLCGVWGVGEAGAFEGAPRAGVGGGGDGFGNGF